MDGSHDYNCCHDALMMFMNLKNIAILSMHGVAYRFIINGISKSEAINSFKNENHYKI